MQSKMLAAGRGLGALLIASGVCLAPAPALAGHGHDEKEPARTGRLRSDRAGSAEDRELARAIERDLQNAELADLDDVRVEVRGGTVTLTGEVDSTLARERAMRIARMYEDVDQVVDRLTLRSGVSRSDQQIKADVERMLQRHSALDVHDIDVDVKNGVVTMTGHADSWRDRRLANDLAESVAGVRRVNNEIDVERTAEARDDAQIRQDIQRRIDRGCDGCDDVDLTVNRGKVTLEGTVFTAEDRRELLDMVWVPGVVEVDDDDLKIDFGARPASRGESMRDRDRRVRGHESRQERRVEARRERDRERLGERRAAYRQDDLAIERELRESFDDDPLFARSEPQVRVDDGVVTLTGTVDSARASRRAGEIAEDMPGVDRVRNDLRVSERARDRRPASSGRSDDDAIQRRIEQALYDDPFFHRHQIKVAVNDGVVRLTGRVPSERERAAAEDIALGVPGVTDVDNDLVVSN